MDSWVSDFRNMHSCLPKPFVFLAYSMLLFFFLMLLGHMSGIFQQIAADKEFFPYAIQDWPDTVAMSKMVENGQFFSGDSRFISGMGIFGLFPPMLYVIVAFIDMAIQNTAISLFILSLFLQIAVTYLLVRDWPSRIQAAILILFLNFNPLASHFFPIVGRVRELLAVFFMVLLFKLDLKFPPYLRYLFFGALAILTQPIVGILALVAYPLSNSKWNPLKIDAKFLVAAALLALVFFATYHQHFILKYSNSGYPAIGCAGSIIQFSSNLISIIAFLIPLAFFFLFLENVPRKLLILSSIALGGLVLISTIPAVYLSVVSLFREDFCLQVFPFISFFALFAPKKLQKNEKTALLVFAILLLQAFYSAVLFAPSFENPSVAWLSLSKIPPNSTVLPLSFFFWEQPRLMLFQSFDFTTLSEIYLRDLPLKAYYSPTQQFYDTEKFLPEVVPFFDSARAYDLNQCRDYSEKLSNRLDYLILYSSTSAVSRNSWTGGEMAKLSNSSFFEKCGVSIIDAGKQNLYVVYGFGNKSSG